MLTYKSEPLEPNAAHQDQDSIQSELDRWRTLAFSFDMEEDQHPRQRSDSNQPQNTQGATGLGPLTAIEDALLLAQFAATTQSGQGSNIPSGSSGHPPGETPMSVLQALQTLQRHGIPTNMGFPQSLPAQRPDHNFQPPHAFLPPNFSGGDFGHMPSGFGQLPTSVHSSANQFPQDYLHIFNNNAQQHAPNTSMMSQQVAQTDAQQQPVASTSSATNSPPDEDVVDDKRRRNTAASARFRIKKKQRTGNLERSVNDLTGRAEELEREASDLRRENGWLKEIIMLKGSRLQLTPDTVSSTMWSSGQGDGGGEASGSKGPSSVEGGGGGDSSDSEYTGNKKGKAKAKPRRKQ